jgi:hypothetical protein
MCGDVRVMNRCNLELWLHTVSYGSNIVAYSMTTNIKIYETSRKQERKISTNTLNCPHCRNNAASSIGIEAAILSNATVFSFTSRKKTIGFQKNEHLILH